MVRILLVGLGAALAMGAVTIAPRRDDRPPREERRESSPAPAAPAPAAAGPRAHQGPGRVGIAPREASPAPSYAAPSYSRSSGAIGPSDYRAPGARTGIYRHDVVRPARYRHWYGGGSHWYGYYGGSRLYWTRPYGGYWWWYDEPYARWAWYNGGHWWYTGPSGVAVIYSQGAPPAPTAAETAAAAPAPAGDAGPWTSPDGRRLVEVVGPDRQAVLYDKTGTAPSYLRLLGTGASKVRFSARGAGPAILVEFADGSFSVFDENGLPLNTAPAAAPAVSTPTVRAPAPPPPPPDLPRVPAE